VGDCQTRLNAYERKILFWVEEGGGGGRCPPQVSLRKEDGTYASSQGEFETLATNFYTALFTVQDNTILL
jgi:hypothetical protein